MKHSLGSRGSVFGTAKQPALKRLSQHEYGKGAFEYVRGTGKATHKGAHKKGY